MTDLKQTPHKWVKEIKAWADGAEIERRMYFKGWGPWHLNKHPSFTENPGVEYRVKEPPHGVAACVTYPRAAYLMAHPQELEKFVIAAEKNADDWLDLNREMAELRESIAGVLAVPRG